MSIILFAMTLSTFLGSPQVMISIASPSTTTSSAKTSSLPTQLVFCGVFPIAARPDAGPDRRDAFYIAVDELNSQTGPNRILPSGTNITAFAVDDANTATGGTAAAGTCLSDNANIVIGSSGSTVSAAIATALNPSKTVQISYASSSPTLSNRTLYPWFMRVAASDVWQAQAVVDLVNSFGWTKGAVISTSDSYGTGLTGEFKKDWSGTVVDTQTFATSATDVSAQVASLTDAVDNKGAQFILLHAIDIDAATVFKEAYKQGITNLKGVTFVLTDGSSTTATFANDADVAAGMQAVIGTTPASLQGPKYQDFNNTWFSTLTCSNSTGGDTPIACGAGRTGAVPNSYAALAYDAVYVAAKGFADAAASDSTFDGSQNGQNSTVLLNTLYGETLQGAGGNISFDNLGETLGRYDAVNLKGSVWQSFGTWENKTDPSGTQYWTFTSNDLRLPGGAMYSGGMTSGTWVCSNCGGNTVVITSTLPGGQTTLITTTTQSTPGFELLAVLVAFGAIIALSKVRKYKKY